MQFGSLGNIFEMRSPKKRRPYLLEWIRRKSLWTYIFGLKNKSPSISEDGIKAK